MTKGNWEKKDVHNKKNCPQKCGSSQADAVEYHGKVSKTIRK